MSHTVSNSDTRLYRRNSFFDQILSETNRALEVLGRSARASRPNPAGKEVSEITADEARHAAGLMRVNHVGEICAQALYRSQAMLCKDPQATEVLLQAAQEEVDHLAWCDDRLRELDSRPSVFNPLWYAGSFALGLLASRAGVPYNLGFMAETERQVEEHLESHLESLPATDNRSRRIVEKMRDDEIEHRRTAENHGAAGLPPPVKTLMRMMSKVMTTTAYRL
ncbi:2-polyprenyl-3-methyl-6-methoxy-1,4-benzoquinone monooxygenase [Alcaligenes faecalis]|jgi:ubiquinone biosynthesis monooxygenase Coq7|uniref:3-demethoxyubiquinol 3-hydroxylase n=1 Tax=Alcaligenes faecalis TaxID=511 RepID=A0A2U2BLA9_ALCFA|nr:MULTISPECIES: 2-polyprenyl-3-methyl-6-methoxy-1,4-benzoquinone monooxygenase [Alcaligenes]ALO38179.1 2-octaprenyl-3-methyl-6-methoxy-1,4-benzoquinol hydroxylase [Alcaligenes faecalis]ARP52473.1 2-nonaprenyl-3-methyl-6-methoxy-1,4-benzoquinol hydroxylase [Alcaligenes faecalis]MBH0309554.1 2-polyprenyl-3-methyl-6-methoxy-1,4-benzoquinone monooxygenase [Alcaligenes faecalis]MBQ0216597.1 2-polyprenyl-3-methyl-6-methoxy-1,4-benzoquinone monooxygenase [Alcaligenes faecalis]MBW4788695.1 2-polypren